MMKKIKIVEQFKGCIAYDCDSVLFVRLEKGTIVSDHTHDYEEIIFLMEGEANAIIGDKTQIIKSPVKVVIPPNVYHKFTAITDLIGLEIK
jgi:quercetin dioxygenase-like cupin family protein